MYSILLAVGIHHREMIQRKSLNYERILNVEIKKTNDLISKLVPMHILNVIKNEKRQVDELDDVTLLYTDMVGFTAFSKGKVKEPREVVNLLSKLFSRFDQLCEDSKVYMVHTIGDCYVIMGYSGRVEKSKRTRAVIVDEAHRVVQTGLEMIDIIREVRESSEDQDLKNLDMRIGIHTGRVVAGIIGSKVVRYDIFGEGVLIANKMESNGIPGRVCVSGETRALLEPSEISAYQFEEHKTFQLASISKQVTSWAVSRRERESMESGVASSEYNRSHSDANRIEEQSQEDSSNAYLEPEDNVEGSRRNVVKSSTNTKVPPKPDSSESAGSSSSQKQLLAGSTPPSQPKKSTTKEPLPSASEDPPAK
jgi:class 3 adenylate cyclase